MATLTQESVIAAAPASEPSSDLGTVPALSIVATLYRSRSFLPAFLDECVQAIRAAGVADWEIVLVSDGSPDDSAAYALARRADIPQLVVAELSRNFGHHHAIQAGMRLARGRQVFLIDCDLEVRPAVLTDFLERQRASGADMVFGYQEVRKGGAFERFSGSLFWRGLNLLSDVPIPENMLTERLMSRRFVDAFLRLGDANLFLGGMMSWTGYVQVGMPVAKKQREGRSTYSLARRVSLMVNAISSFSSKPLTWMFNIGVCITALSMFYVAYLVFRRLAFGDTLLGFTSMMGLMAISLGIMTTAVGLVGIYLGKVFNQVQARPTFIIKDIHR
jgi:putative glycosyltransferase